MITINPYGKDVALKISEPDSTRFKTAIERIKTLPSRRYDPTSKVWVIPSMYINDAMKVLDGLDVVCNIELLSDKQPSGVAFDTMQIFDFAGMKYKLYDFQTIGASFLLNVKCGLLGDEMGLGKTIQAIAAAYKLYQDGVASKALVLCPASLKYQWAEEIEKFTDLTCTVIDGSKDKRQMMYYDDTFFTIVNYELLLRDMEYIQELYPDIIICDEIHRASNIRAKTTQQLLKLDAQYKWGLTGTPIQNKPEEVYSIFSFIVPTLFGSYWPFRKRYIVVKDMYGRKNVPVGYKNLDELHRKIAPYLLRRMKKDVAKDLPDIITTIRKIDMTSDQKQLHNIVFDDLKELAESVDHLVERNEYGEIVKKPPEYDRTLGYFTLLQEIADSLELLDMSESKMAVAYNIKSKDSPKLDELIQICRERLDSNPNAKTVIFTKFERMQTLIYKALSKLGKCVVLNGSVEAKERQHIVNMFNNDLSVKFFLSTDAGNYGISLPAADCLISFDIPWNPAVFAQRINRIHRLTSTYESVEVIVLIAKDSIDEIIYNTLYKKLAVTSAVIDYTTDEKQSLDRLTLAKIKEIIK